jgi:hypothetical protein
MVQEKPTNARIAAIIFHVLSMAPLGGFTIGIGFSAKTSLISSGAFRSRKDGTDCRAHSGGYIKQRLQRGKRIAESAVIADIIFTASVLVFVMTILDLLLSENQKAVVGLWLTRAWNWVDEIKAKQLRVARSWYSKFWPWVKGCFLFALGLEFLCQIVDIFLLPISLPSEFELPRYWVIFGLLTFAALLPMVLAGVALVFIYILYWIISSLEFFVRRMAEQSKGPLVVLSVISGGLITLLKAFT